jgi:hypothetical protein
MPLLQTVGSGLRRLWTRDSGQQVKLSFARYNPHRSAAAISAAAVVIVSHL